MEKAIRGRVRRYTPQMTKQEFYRENQENYNAIYRGQNRFPPSQEITVDLQKLYNVAILSIMEELQGLYDS